MRPRLIVGVTGASGAALALETLRLLAQAKVETHLVVSAGARMTIAHELGADGHARLAALADDEHSPRNLGAPNASGAVRTVSKNNLPCSKRCHSASEQRKVVKVVAHAADTGHEERRRRGVTPHRTPLHEGPLEAMLRLARLGAVVAPPVPPFYARPATIDDMLREIAARLVNWAGVDPGEALTRWSGND